MMLLLIIRWQAYKGRDSAVCMLVHLVVKRLYDSWVFLVNKFWLAYMAYIADSANKIGWAAVHLRRILAGYIHTEERCNALLDHQMAPHIGHMSSTMSTIVLV